MARPRIPALPQLLDRKLYKSGQTRGADDDEIFQNRVLRNSTVLIRLANWDACRPVDEAYENGFIVVVDPEWYFQRDDADQQLADLGLELGRNAVVFYQRRADWLAFPPDVRGWTVATSRLAPLGGQYVARVAATTAADRGSRINLGFTTTAQKGLGVRVYEYASSDTIRRTRIQLEALYWLCRDSLPAIIEGGMGEEPARRRMEWALQTAVDEGLLDREQLRDSRALSTRDETICPLCLEELSPLGFVTRLTQAEGREVHDLTVTQINLFHIEELRVGRLNHRPYNLGWGHHHCNTVARDAGIAPTLEWMRDVLRRNDESAAAT